MEQSRYDQLYQRFQKQVSIPNTPEKLNDEELEELIRLLHEDAAQAGKRKERTPGTRTKSSPKPISQEQQDKLAELLKNLGANK